jgi:hypothetical protein
LDGATIGDVEDLLVSCISHLSPEIYLKLATVLLENAKIDWNQQKSTIKNILVSLSRRNDWPLTFGFLDRIRLLRRSSMSTTVLNLILEKAAGTRDLWTFIRAYEYFQTFNVTPNARTYSILVFWNSTRPTVQHTVRDYTKIHSQINSILADFKDDAGIGEKEIQNLLSVGRKDDAWAYFHAIDPVKICPGQDLLTDLAKNIRNSADFRHLLAFNNLVDGEIFSKVLQSEWAHSTGFDLDYLLNATFSSAKVTLDFCNNLWRYIDSQGHADGCIIVFGRLLTDHTRALLLDAFVSNSSDPSLVDIRELARSKDYRSAHFEILSRLCKTTVDHKDWKSASALLQAVFVNELGTPNPVLLEELLRGASRDGRINKVMALLKIVIARHPRIIGNFTWNVVLRSIYDSGRQEDARELQEDMNSQPCIPVAAKIYANLLFSREIGEKFITHELPIMAGRDSRALSAALGGLLRRFQFAQVPKLFRQVAKMNPQIVQLLHFALAIQGAAMTGDQKAILGLRTMMVSSGFEKVFSEFTRSITRDESPQLEPTPGHQAMGLALLLVLYSEKGLRAFNSSFFKIYDKSFPPNLDAIRTMLAMNSDFGRDDGEVFGSEWGSFFFAWLEQFGVIANGAIYTKLLYLCNARADTSLAEFILQKLADSEIVITYPLYKELLPCLKLLESDGRRSDGLFDVAMSLFAPNRRVHLRLDVEWYKVFVDLAIRESRLEDGVNLILQSITDKQPVPPEIVTAFLDHLFKAWPLGSFIPVLDQLHRDGFLASSHVYEQFLREALGRRDLKISRHFFRYLLRTRCLPKQHDALNVLKLCLEQAHIQDAHTIHAYMLKSNLLPSDMRAFDAVLDHFLGAKVNSDTLFLSSVPPMKELQRGSITELLDFAARKGVTLPLTWCTSALENLVTWGDFDTARRLHLFMATTGLLGSFRMGPRVSSLWMKQLACTKNQ